MICLKYKYKKNTEFLLYDIIATNCDSSYCTDNEQTVTRSTGTEGLSKTKPSLLKPFIHKVPLLVQATYSIRGKQGNGRMC